MRLPALMFVLALAVASPALAQQTEPHMSADIRQVLDDSAVDWSRGDLDGFMDSYERSDDVTFIGSSGPVKGWQAIRDRYQAAYGGASADSFGQLSFEILELRPIDGWNALVTGRYHLMRGERTDGGIFTLLFKLGPNGWRIAYDHTS
jgi:hypothetical protein